MMPRLEAEEALSRVSQIAAGNGLMEQKDQQKYLTELRRTMNAGRQQPGAMATEASLAYIGIKTVTEEPTTTKRKGVSSERDPRRSSPRPRRQPGATGRKPGQS